MVSISPRWGGLLVERAWESITRDLGHLERCNALLSRARAAVMAAYDLEAPSDEERELLPSCCRFFISGTCHRRHR